MKFKTLLAVAMASVASYVSFADQGDVLITFSTPGPDKYADDSTVKDGEWYALVFSKNAAFGGLTTACAPAVAGDELLLAAPLAKAGKCPFVAFEVARDDAKFAKGHFEVILLDTRDANGNPALANPLTKLPAMLNGQSLASSLAKGVKESTSAVTTVAAGSAAWGESAVVTESEPVKISSIKVAGARVTLTVDNMLPGVRYNVKMGETVDNLDSYALAVPATVDQSEVVFDISSDKAKFFQVVREPLKK